MAIIKDQVRSLRDRLDEFESKHLEPIRDLDIRAHRLMKVIDKVGASWSGSTFDSYHDMYFGDFDVPPSGRGFSTVSLALRRGLPPGWRSRTAKEVQDYIEDTASEEIETVQAELRNFAILSTRFERNC